MESGWPATNSAESKPLLLTEQSSIHWLRAGYKVQACQWTEALKSDGNMSAVPTDLQYTKDHEWVRDLGDGVIAVGITDYAQGSLGDVTFVELPDLGSRFEEGDAFGVVESVKAASDLYMPVAGEVIEINEALADAPETVNSDPYGAAWMIRVRVDENASREGLMDPAAYGAIVD
jgi:glycine cleavage system H protein